MMKTLQVHQQLPNTSGATTTLQIPTGGKIHQIFVRFSDSTNTSNTEAMIRAQVTGNIRLSFGAIDIVNVPVARLLDIYKMLGNKVGNTSTITVGGMPLNLAPLFYVDPAAKDLLGLGTANVNNIQIQITFGTIVAVTGTLNTQSFTTREPVNQNLGTYGKITDYPRNFNAASQDTVDTLPRNINSAYLALFINLGSAGVATDSEIRVNGGLVREKVPLHINTWLNNIYGFATQAADAAGDGGYFAHIFCHGGISEYLPMKNVTDLRALTTFSTAPGAGGYTATPLTLENFLGV